MRKGRSTAARTPKKPADAEAGAALVRKFAIKLFDRDEGEAANWPLIAETLFKAAFDGLDRPPDDAGAASAFSGIFYPPRHRPSLRSALPPEWRRDGLTVFRVFDTM